MFLFRVAGECAFIVLDVFDNCIATIIETPSAAFCSDFGHFS